MPSATPSAMPSATPSAMRIVSSNWPISFISSV
eukprot:CAMPEP_0115885766 /NCGR_PEP_ID=MMETSP0287-20121206/30850_1 /TAXON_ID=412157 /ORGANISM="Chrysochromulina rotalis, Strain UIO044" /LENGTH=32 /DNA_ID= /DNA_START= /DNA_END= /DNA_ORIENTATION=